MRYLLVLVLIGALFFASLTVICAAPPSYTGGSNPCQQNADTPVHFASLSTLDVAGFSTFLVVALPLALLVSRSSADDRSPVRLGSPPLLPPPRRP